MYLFQYTNYQEQIYPLETFEQLENSEVRELHHPKGIVSRKIRKLIDINVFPIFYRQMDAIHGFAREGDVASLLKCVENGVSVNLKGELFIAIAILILYIIHNCVESC